MTSSQSFSKISALFTAFAVCLCVVIDHANGGAKESKNVTDKVGTSTQKQIEAESKLYKEAHEHIFKAEQAWEAEMEQKKKEQNAKKELHWNEIKKAAAGHASAPIGAEHPDQIMIELEERVAKAQADNADAIKRFNEAVEAKRGAEKALVAAQLKLGEAENARNIAEMEKKRLEEEYNKAQNCQQNASNQLKSMQEAEKLMEQYEQEHSQKKGRLEKMAPHTTKSMELRKNLLQLIQKQYLIDETETLTNAIDTGTYKRAVTAAKLGSLTKHKDIILYLSNKYFGIERAQIEGNCQSPEGKKGMKKLGSFKGSFKKSLRNTSKESQPSDTLQIATTAVCAYNQIVARLSEAERQKLQANDENGTNAATKAARIGEEVDKEIADRFNELIKENKINEYPIDGLQQQQGQKLKQVMVDQQQEFPGFQSGVDQLESAGSPSFSATVKDISEAGGSGIDQKQQTLEEITPVEKEITEIQQQNVSEPIISESRAQKNDQPRAKRTLAHLLSEPEDQSVEKHAADSDRADQSESDNKGKAVIDNVEVIYDGNNGKESRQGDNNQQQTVDRWPRSNSVRSKRGSAEKEAST